MLISYSKDNTKLATVKKVLQDGILFFDKSNEFVFSNSFIEKNKNMFKVLEERNQYKVTSLWKNKRYAGFKITKIKSK